MRSEVLSGGGCCSEWRTMGEVGGVECCVRIVRLRSVEDARHVPAS